jgi:hypothetical protein
LVHHYNARLDLFRYLHKNLVVRDAHDLADKARLRDGGTPADEANAKVLRGLLSIDECMAVLQAYDAEVQMINSGKRESYQELRTLREA